MPDTDLTAVLAEIRLRGYRNGASGAMAARLSDCADLDVPRLLAAVDAVLAHHQPQPGMFPPTCFACAAWDEDAEETVEACWPCPTYLAISRALLGPEGPEGASG